MKKEQGIKDIPACKGVFGRWFGHNFQRYLLRPAYKLRDWYSISISNDQNLLKYIDSQRDEYIVVCQRCGLELTKDQCES